MSVFEIKTCVTATCRKCEHSTEVTVFEKDLSEVEPAVTEALELLGFSGGLCDRCNTQRPEGAYDEV